MQKFKNGDEVLWCPEPDGNPDKWVQAHYVGGSIGHFCQHVIKKSTGCLVYCHDDHIKPQPDTISIRGVEVPKPLTKEDADDCRVTATPLTLFFRSYEDAARFNNALNGIKEGCDDE